jgi:alpha-L-fucosidase
MKFFFLFWTAAVGLMCQQACSKELMPSGGSTGNNGMNISVAKKDVHAVVDSSSVECAIPTATNAPADVIESKSADEAGKIVVPNDPVFAIASGPFKPDWKSLQQYNCPDWFRDAKFGIFMHWGLPAVVDENRPFFTGHYARGMYYQHGKGTAPFCKDIYDWHVQHYGHPSQFGYKDLIPLWKAQNWDPDALVAFYKSIGARYIVPVAVHHDNFDIYDSSYQRWNVAQMGPKRDILGEWKRAAEKQGLHFGASTHLDRAPSFLSGSWGSDWEGPLKGVPYDGSDPKYQDFYLKGVPLEQFQKNWFQRTKEIIDKYQPELLYFDGSLPFGDYGLRLAAHFYNTNASRHQGQCEAVLNLKRGPSPKGFVFDIERGQSDGLRDDPWQTDTTLIGGWFYHKAEVELSAPVLVANLVDIVSKNGNLLLNVSQKPDGTLPENQRAVLEQLGGWLKVNGDAIYGTRPWKIFGEGPTQVKAGSFNEPKSAYTPEDFRFTTKGDRLFAIALGFPQNGKLKIHSLAANSPYFKGEITSVRLLGSTAKLKWTRDPSGLSIDLPSAKPCDHAITLEIGGTHEINNRGND